jgi:hypothetical protein
VQAETVMEKWNTVGGITIPVLRKNKQNGEDSSTAEISSIELNPTVDPKIFDKPAEKPADRP